MLVCASVPAVFPSGVKFRAARKSPALRRQPYCSRQTGRLAATGVRPQIKFSRDRYHLFHRDSPRGWEASSSSVIKFVDAAAAGEDLPPWSRPVVCSQQHQLLPTASAELAQLCWGQAFNLRPNCLAVRGEAFANNTSDDVANQCQLRVIVDCLNTSVISEQWLD